MRSSFLRNMQRHRILSMLSLMWMLWSSGLTKLLLLSLRLQENWRLSFVQVQVSTTLTWSFPRSAAWSWRILLDRIPMLSQSWRLPWWFTCAVTSLPLFPDARFPARGLVSRLLAMSADSSARKLRLSVWAFSQWILSFLQRRLPRLALHLSLPWRNCMQILISCQYISLLHLRPSAASTTNWLHPCLRARPS